MSAHPAFSGYFRSADQVPDPITQAIERQLEIERKAEAWDKLRTLVREVAEDPRAPLSAHMVLHQMNLWVPA